MNVLFKFLGIFHLKGIDLEFLVLNLMKTDFVIIWLIQLKQRFAIDL